MIKGYEFADYLLIGPKGWEGLRPDAPPEAVKAYEEALQLLAKQYDSETGLITNY